MTEQYTSYANVRVEDIPPYHTYQKCPDWGVSWRSPVKYKSLNGLMEYHYILEWRMPTPNGLVLTREEYFGDKLIYTSYHLNGQEIKQVERIKSDSYKLPNDNTSISTEAVPIDTASSTDQKLDTVIGHLEKLLAKFPGGYRLGVDYGPADDSGTPLQYFGAMPDEENSVNPWVVKMPDEKNPGRAIPFYVGDYLHAEALTGERIIVDGEEYLIMQDNLKRRYRVSRKTQIVHLMDYVRVYNVGAEPSIDGWRSSSGRVVVCGPEGERTPLVTGTKYKVLDHAVMNPTEINPGTLAVRYADYNYPTL